LTRRLSRATIEQMFDSCVALEDATVTWQASLFGFDDPSFDPALPGLERTWLDGSSWVDHAPRWLQGSDQVFAELVARLAWRQRRVPMYGRMLDEPRLTWWWREQPGGEGVPLALLDEMRRLLSSRYEVDFDSIGCNLYRDGRDSVAWHGDRMRHQQSDPLVAIVSIGAPRPFLIRPRGGGPSHAYLLGQGDLLVMGGACQHDWEHTVPKVAAAGPRLSITYRHDEPPPEAVTRHPSAHRPGQPRR
jgi:alkylated DNA repair dioxygenase AlkB